jgi:hypothetical protein
MKHDILIELHAYAQGYNYTEYELVNWLCTQFDMSIAQAELYVAEYLCSK